MSDEARTSLLRDALDVFRSDAGMDGYGELTDDELAEIAYLCADELRQRLPRYAIQQGDLPEFHEDAVAARERMAYGIKEAIDQGDIWPPEDCPTCDGMETVKAECNQCDGEGYEPGSSTEACEACDGTGEVTQDCSECL